MPTTHLAPAPAVAQATRPRPVLSARELSMLAAALVLAIAPNLPFVVADSVLYGRVRNWAIFLGGLLAGAVLALARERLPSGTGPRR